jgi:serine/threonine protein kinase
LYSRAANTWKITDFGLASEGTSRRLHTTKYAISTECYRAPELLRDGTTYNNKADIWSMGCILYEIAIGHKPFKMDWGAIEYLSSREPLLLPIELIVARSLTQDISSILLDMLGRDPGLRPSARDLCELFYNNLKITTIADIPSIASRFLGLNINLEGSNSLFVGSSQTSCFARLQ